MFDDPSAAAASLADAPMVFVATPWRIARLGLFALAFVAVGAWESRLPGDWNGVPARTVGWCAAGLGALGGAAALAQWFRPPVLTLTAGGLRLRVFARELSLAWSEVERFALWSPRRGGRARFVGYRRRGPPRTALETVNRALGCDGAIPDQFTIRPPALLALCEASRRRWG